MVSVHCCAVFAACIYICQKWKFPYHFDLCGWYSGSFFVCFLTSKRHCWAHCGLPWRGQNSLCQREWTLTQVFRLRSLWTIKNCWSDSRFEWNLCIKRLRTPARTNVISVLIISLSKERQNFSKAMKKKIACRTIGARCPERMLASKCTI